MDLTLELATHDTLLLLSRPLVLTLILVRMVMKKVQIRTSLVYTEVHHLVWV